ncbi:hypothetical protein C8R48DRAFT_721489 [Suillus tomentosus]|nr:hypothetical protein C8R48DRAFT_721489 [Suillus tomentosus]
MGLWLERSPALPIYTGALYNGGHTVYTLVTVSASERLLLDIIYQLTSLLEYVIAC